MKNETTGNYRVTFVSSPSLADYMALYVAAGWPYKEVAKLLQGLQRSSLFEVTND